MLIFENRWSRAENLQLELQNFVGIGQELISYTIYLNIHVVFVELKTRKDRYLEETTKREILFELWRMSSIFPKFVPEFVEFY